MATRGPNFRIRATDDTRAAFASVSQGLAGINAKALGLSGGFAGLQNQVRGLIAVVGAGALVRGLTGVTQEFDEISKGGQKIGLTTEQLSILRYTADRAGVDFQKLTQGIGKFSTVLVQAQDETSEQGKLLKSLGVDITQGPQKALRDLADAFADLENGEVKTAVASKIFGEDVGRNLIPLLNQGASGFDEMAKKAARYGQVVSTETGRAAEAFNDQLDDTIDLLKGSAKAIVAGMLPALDDLTAAFSDSAVEGDKWVGVGQTIGQTLRDLVAEGKKTATEFQVLGLRLGGAAAFTVELAKGNKEAAKVILGEIQRDVRKTFEDSNKVIERLRGNALDLRTAFGFDADKSGRTPRTPDLSIGPKPKKETDDFKRALEALNAELNREQAEGSKVLEIIGQYEQGTLKVTAAQKDALVAVAAKIDAYKEEQKVQEEAAKAAEDFAKRTIAAAQERARAIEQLLGATKTGRIEENRRQFALVAAELERGGENAAKAKEAMRLLDEELASIAGKTDDVSSSWQDLGPVFVSAFEDALVQGADLRELLDSLDKDLLRIASRELFTKPLEGAFADFTKSLGGGGGGGLGGIFSGIFGGAGGAVAGGAGALSAADLATAFAGFADGGSFRVGGSGGTDSQLVAFRASPDETVTVSKPGQGGGGGHIFNINVSVPPGTSAQSARQLGLDLGVAVQQAMRLNA